MRKVAQTAFGRPDGNCFEACLASILELSLEEVPHFIGDDWLYRYNQWLRWHFSLQLITFTPYGMESLSPHTYAIANGPNHHGRPHSVVIRGGARGAVVHDPNPSSSGLLVVETILVFVAVNPARMPRRKARRGKSV